MPDSILRTMSVEHPACSARFILREVGLPAALFKPGTKRKFTAHLASLDPRRAERSAIGIRQQSAPMKRCLTALRRPTMREQPVS